MKSKKKMKIRKNNFLILLFFLILSSCVSTEYSKLRIELPRKPALSLDPFDEIVLTNFFVKKETKEFSLNKDIQEYFTSELKQNIKKKISTDNFSIEQEGVFKDENFWKKLSPDRKSVLYFTGTAEYTAETRKALLRKEKKRFEDPFQSPSRIAQQKFYTLQIELFLIDAQTGKAIYRRNYKETKSYKNPNQTAYFAFFDLIQSVKEKFFSTILGTEQIQERYLITH